MHQTFAQDVCESYVKLLGMCTIDFLDDGNLSETIERGVMTDLEAGIRLKRFQVDSVQAAII
jgi:hypothetical protein